MFLEIVFTLTIIWLFSLLILYFLSGIKKENKNLDNIFNFDNEEKIKERKFNLFLDEYQKIANKKEENIFSEKDLDYYKNQFYNFKNEENNEFKILKVKNIFTKYELIFYKELKNLLKNTNYNLLSKVRIADLIETKNNVSYNEFIKIFNKINRKHIDFVICDENGNILILIELDGYSHNYKKIIESDNLKNSLFSSLQIPLLRFKNGYKHDLEQLKKLLYI